MRIYLLVILGLLSVNSICGQEFAANYEKITKDNIENYFADWEKWSDRMWNESKKEGTDSINALYNKLFAHFDSVEYYSRCSKYITLPHEINVSFYNDSLKYDIIEDWDEFSERQKKLAPYKTITFRPHLEYRDKKCLYYHYTDSLLDRQLEEFLGGSEIEWGEVKMQKDKIELMSAYITPRYSGEGNFWSFSESLTIKDIEYYSDGYCVFLVEKEVAKKYFVPYANLEEYKLMFMIID